ncbi:MAG: MaoC family dehydratase [Alphaproteobacteria bacterium]|nr:MaoC family dehydratase [Alphaproteobacteria bacterium]
MNQHATADQVYYLDDLVVGQRFTSGSRTLNAEEIKIFAREFDPQPFHVDEEAARGTFFQGLAASGWHAAAIAMSLMVRGGLPIAGGIIGAGGEIAWRKPIRPGDTLHVESEIVEVTASRSKPERGTVAVRSDTINQNGEIVQTFTARLIVPRRPA